MITDISYEKFKGHYPRECFKLYGIKFLIMVRDCIAEDYRTSTAASMHYQEYHTKEDFSFPSIIGDRFLISNTYETINLNDVPIAAYPWKFSRLVNITKDIDYGDFHEDSYNHHILFLKEMNIAFVTGGNHAICRGIYLQKGTVNVRIYDCIYLFNHAQVNKTGDLFTNNNGEPIIPIRDPRLAMIYELSLQIYLYKKARLIAFLEKLKTRIS